MKLWEVESAFARSQPDMVRSVVCAEPWRARYCDAFAAFGNAVESQDRDLLDQEMPLALTREIARRCTMRFYLYSGPQREEVSLLRSLPLDGLGYARVTELSALEVHDFFGGAVIEEVREYGSAHVTYEVNVSV